MLARHSICCFLAFGLIVITACYTPAGASTDRSRPDNPIPQDTTALIDRHGLPVAKVPSGNGDDSHFLLYNDGDSTDGLLIDVGYLIDDEGHVEQKIIRAADGNGDNGKEDWFRETVNELKQTVDSLEETKDSIDRNINTLPGLNYFDRVDVLTDEMEFELGGKTDGSRTTFVLEPTRKHVSFTFRVPIGL